MGSKLNSNQLQIEPSSIRVSWPMNKGEEVAPNNRQYYFILIRMRSPLQSPKANKNTTKKANQSQQINPTKAQITKIDPSPIKIVQVSKSPKRTQSSIDKKRYMMRTNSALDNDIGYEMQQKEKDLKHKMQRLCSCVELFNMMQGNNMQLRCVQHSNILTLYCLTERKVLCVNCNYGDMKHKTHKILPLKDSNSYISEDNSLLKEMLNKDLKIIEESIRNCQQNTMLLQNQMKSHIATIQKQYTKKLQDLKSKYEQQIQKIKKNFSSAIKKSNSLQREVEQFKFKIWETISKVGTGKRSQAASNETEIARQVLCSNLAEFTIFELRKLGKKDVEKLLHKSKFS